MPYLKNLGYWIPDLTPKQVDIFNSQKRALLVSGPRFSGKTWGVLHKVCRHLWDINAARVGLFSKTIKSAKDGGVWEDLLNIAIPEWQRSGIGFEFTTVDRNGNPGPRTDNVTKTSYFRIRNRWGTESELKLFSIDYDDDVEHKVKNTRFSMMWFSELSNFRLRKVFDASYVQLRMPHVPEEEHQWIGDTNPDEEGEDHWIYQLWYMERLQKDHPDPQFQSELGLTEVLLDHNDRISDSQKNRIKGLYRHDQELYDRYVHGIWVKGHGKKGRHFSEFFRPAIHVLGNASSPNRSDWNIVLPSKDCTNLVSGWDLGNVNHAAIFMEKRLWQDCWVWLVIDELVHVGEEMIIPDFAMIAQKKIHKLERVIGKKPVWSHWSDDSAFNMFRATSDSYDYLEVQNATGGEIQLEPVRKAQGSIAKRIQVAKKLLHQNRIRVSAHCTETIKMFKNLRRGEKETEVIAKNDPNKHVFDALTYAILMETGMDLVDSLDNQVKSIKEVEPEVSCKI